MSISYVNLLFRPQIRKCTIQGKTDQSEPHRSALRLKQNKPRDVQLHVEPLYYTSIFDNFCIGSDIMLSLLSVRMKDIPMRVNHRFCIVVVTTENRNMPYRIEHSYHWIKVRESLKVAHEPIKRSRVDFSALLLSQHVRCGRNTIRKCCSAEFVCE